jgi:hypothetical protein
MRSRKVIDISYKLVLSMLILTLPDGSSRLIFTKTNQLLSVESNSDSSIFGIAACCARFRLSSGYQCNIVKQG